MNHVYQEEGNSTFTHDGKLYDLNKLLQITESFTVHQVNVSSLTWIFKHGVPDDKRVEEADISVPILITLWNGKWTVIDGFHRLTRAYLNRVKQIPAKIVKPHDLLACLINS